MIYIANLKMYLSYDATLTFYKNHHTHLEQLSKTKNATIILCPSFLAVAPLVSEFQNSSIKIGAQHCSAHTSGAFTGQVDARSLAQVGCSYALVGHSETRAYMHENPSDLTGQITQLTANNIIPVICIGETQEQYAAGATLNVLADQLSVLQLALSKNSHTPYLLAYEPVWAIGSGITPTTSQLQTIKAQIFATLAQLGIRPPQGFLYGGSVNPKTMPTLATADCFDGYLIGSASLDFQTFEKIVSWAL